MVPGLAGNGSRVLGVEADLLKPLQAGQKLKLDLRLVDKGRGTRILFGRGVGEIVGIGAFAVVLLRILLAPSVPDPTHEEVIPSP